MNDTLFIFGVLPASVAFVGFVFTLVFGADILNWYRGELAAQRKHVLAPVETAPFDRHDEERYAEPTPRVREREMAHS